MCGIVGTVGRKEAAPVILDALKKLEYRGYDSAGIATFVNSHLESSKGIGKLSQVEDTCHLSRLPGVGGIGHVRWATHGGVTVANTHPHFDCAHKIAIVHNGIIENFRELRGRLAQRHTFTSETDTEVIVHLIEENMQPGVTLEKAVYEATRQLKGSYALLAICSFDSDKVVAARRDSPLVIGLGEDCNFAASDALCFLDSTRRVIFIEDGETVVLTRNGVSILDNDFREVRREPIVLDYNAEEAARQGYDFYMLKEIREQPQAIRRSLMQDKNAIMDMALDILRAKQIVFTGCGTSRHAALIGRYVFSRVAGKFSEVVMSSELQYFTDSIDKNTLVIAISQSGETADVIHGVRKAKENGARVFSIVNVQGSTLARMSDRVIYLHCGPEICVAATKSFTAQVSAFYLLAYAMVNRLEEGIEKLLRLSELIDANIKSNCKGLDRLAFELKDKKNFYYLGRGINFAVAAEGALKLKEIAYVHAEGMPGGELKHGTLALVEPGIPVIAVCPGDYTFAEMISNVLETKARGSFVIGISDKPDPAFDKWVHIPQVEEIFYPLVSVIPLQLLAYYSAVARGFDPDKPRNLAKSVTVK